MTRKIAHVISTPARVGGAERVLIGLIKGGFKRGWDQIVLNPFDLTPTESELAKHLDGVYSAVRTTRMHQLVQARRWLKGEVARFGADLLHAHLFHALVLTATLPQNEAVPSVLSHQHGNHLVMQGERVKERVDRWAGRRYNRVVACSEWVRRFLIERYGYPNEKVVRIHNGWEGEPLSHVGSSSGTTIVSVANLRDQKGHASLIRALNVVRRDIPSATLVLVGDGPLKVELHQLADSLGLKDAVVFTGGVDDVWSHLAQADLFALPSLYEPLGIAILEAMAAGLPVVASAVGGIPELVDNEVTGLLVPPNDVDALAFAITDLLQSPAKAVAMGRAGRAAAEELRMEEMVAQYFGLYEEILTGAAAT